MKRFLLQISYDGTNFSGWQVQPQTRTVQSTIEKALFSIAKEDVKIFGSGRTDSGVHALNQYAHCDIKIDIKPGQLIKALNSNLPGDVLIKDIIPVPDDFSARYDARLRTYQYVITRSYDPLSRLYKSYIPKIKYDVDLIRNCLPYFVGTNDFTSFSKHNPEIKNYECNVEEITLEQNRTDLVFSISANRFLHNMVRRIVGTVLNISHFQYDPEIIKDIFEQQDPSQNIIYTAPPEGLYLKDVKYELSKSSDDAV